MVNSAGKLLLRAVANALWLPLRRALVDGWPVVTDWYVHDPTGQGRTSGYVTASGLPSPTPKLEPINEVGRVMGRLEPEDWPGDGRILVARLTEDDYRMLHAQLTTTELVEWTNAWYHGSARQPFLLDANRHGTPTLRRNHDPRALITPLVADFLAALAGLADVRLLTPAEERERLAEALRDSEDPMRPSEVFAIADRAGIEPPE